MPSNLLGMLLTARHRLTIFRCTQKFFEGSALERVDIKRNPGVLWQVTSDYQSTPSSGRTKYECAFAFS